MKAYKHVLNEWIMIDDGKTGIIVHYLRGQINYIDFETAPGPPSADNPSDGISWEEIEMSEKDIKYIINQLIFIDVMLTKYIK